MKYSIYKRCPLINEVFGEHYTGKENIIFSPNEHFINQQDGKEEERITDVSFKILGKKKRNIIGNVRAPLIIVCW